MYLISESKLPRYVTDDYELRMNAATLDTPSPRSYRRLYTRDCEFSKFAERPVSLGNETCLHKCRETICVSLGR